MNFDKKILSKEHVETCDIYSRTTGTKDSAGRIAETWTKITTTAAVKCLIQPLSAKQTLAMQGLKINAQYICFITPDITATYPVQTRYKVVSNSKTYYVQHIKKTWSTWNSHVELYMSLEPNENEISSGY